MALDPLITGEDLRLALSKATFLALFDDELTGEVEVVESSPEVAQVLRRAHIRTVSWLGANYNKVPLVTDTDVSELLKDAELNYAIGMSYDRHPEYVRQYGEDVKRKAAYEQAELCMMRVQEATLRLVDSPSMAEPENVGAVIVDSGQRQFLGVDSSGALNSGAF
jgi:hypothetical protein